MSKLSVSIYNREGKKVGDLALDASVFGVKPNPNVLHEATVAQQANARPSIAHTKTRADVRGGGRKPWRQKGTGRARHGSTRSPIWVGGGITFGPRSDRNFSLKLNRKTRSTAIKMSLSDKVADGKLVVLDELTAPEFKTKAMAKVLGAMPVKAAKTLLILPVRDEKLSMSVRNIPGVRTINAASLNVVDILGAGTVLTTQAGVERITRTFAAKNA